MKIQAKILKNIGIVSISTGVTSVIGLAMIPFLINHLGPLEFATYIFFNLFLVTGYAGLLFFGLQATVIKLTAQYFEEELKKCNTFFSTVLIFIILYSFLVSIISCVFYPTLVELISSKISNSTQNIQLILITIFVSYPIFFVQIFLDSTLEGLQRYDFLKAYKILFTILNSLGIVFLLLINYSLLEIYLLQAFLSLVSNVLILIFLKNVGIGFDKYAFDKYLLKGTLKFSYSNYLSQVSSTIFYEIDRILITIWLPSIYLTYYEVATKMPRALKLIISFSSILLPLSSQLNSKSSIHKLQLLFCSGSKLTCFVAFPFFGSVIYLSEDILSLWVGKEFAFLAGPFNDMVIWSLLSIVITIGTNILLGSIKYLKPVMYYSWTITISKIIISVSLLEFFNLRAITYAYLYSNLVTLPILIFYLQKFLQINIKFYFNYIKLPIIFFISSLLCNLLSIHLITVDFINFLVKSVVFITISFFLSFYLFLNTFERNFIKRIMSKYYL